VDDPKKQDRDESELTRAAVSGRADAGDGAPPRLFATRVAAPKRDALLGEAHDLEKRLAKER
jgi:hypothetical protein